MNAVDFSCMLCISAILHPFTSSQNSQSPDLGIAFSPDNTNIIESHQNDLYGKSWRLLPHQRSETHVCTTPRCIQRGEEMVAAIDFSIDPCQDFYQFACGSWIKSVELNPAENYRSVVGDLETRIKVQLHQALLTETTEESTAKITAKSFYRQCLDTGLADSIGMQPLLSLLDNVIGGWPVMTPNWNSDNFDLIEALISARKLGISPFVIDYAVRPDPTNASQNVIFIMPSDGFGKDIMSTTNGARFIRTYPQLMEDAARYLSNNLTSLNLTQLRTDIDEVYKLQVFLTDISRSTAETRESNDFQSMTFADFRSSYFSHSELSRGLGDYLRSGFEGYDIRNGTQIFVASPIIFPLIDAKLVELRNRSSAESKRIFANFIGWQIISSFAATLSPSFWQMFRKQDQIVMGTTEDLPKWMECIAIVTNFMPVAVGSMYIDHYVDPRSKDMVGEIIADIQCEFKSMILSSDWMDEETKNYAIRKSNAMLFYVLYPNGSRLYDTSLDQRYAQLNIGESFFATVGDWTARIARATVAQVGTINERENHFADMDASSSNGFYNPANNYLAVLAGIAQPPYFDALLPGYSNYGGLGWVVGHEISHGFDNIGSQRDVEGRLFDWWSDESRSNFEQKAQGLLSQYNNFQTAYGPVNGNLTLTENIADNGGLKAAFQAFQRKLFWRDKNNLSHLSLPGLEGYNPQQLFFLSAAQLWCAHLREDFEELTFLTDVHSPNRVRVNAVLSNIPEFASAFECPPNSTMNPETRFGIW